MIPSAHKASSLWIFLFSSCKVLLTRCTAISHTPGRPSCRTRRYAKIAPVIILQQHIILLKTVRLRSWGTITCGNAPRKNVVCPGGVAGRRVCFSPSSPWSQVAVSARRQKKNHHHGNVKDCVVNMVRTDDMYDRHVHSTISLFGVLYIGLF